VQLDRGALRVEAEAGLPLLVGADAVVGDEGPACACDRTILPVWNTVPTLARPSSWVQAYQTLVCSVNWRRKQEPEQGQVRQHTRSLRLRISIEILGVVRFAMVHTAPYDASLALAGTIAVGRGDPAAISVNEITLPKSERNAFTLRLKPEVFAFVKHAAEDENRSAPNFVETVLLAEKRRREALNTSLGEAK